MARLRRRVSRASSWEGERSVAEANAFRSEGIGFKAQQRAFVPWAGEKETARPASRVRQVIDEHQAIAYVDPAHRGAAL